MIYLVLTSVGGDWLADGGTLTSACSSAAELLAAIRAADRTEYPELETGSILLEIQAIGGGWHIRLVASGRVAAFIVRDAEDSAARVWAQIGESKASLRGVFERVDQIAYSGEADDSLAIGFGDDVVEVKRGSLRVASRVGRLLWNAARAISKPGDGGV